MEALITNYDATLVSLKVPDRFGNPVDVVLGYDSFEEYLRGGYYFGCIVGRYANRIAGGQFALQGKICTVAKNEGDNHLHGGTRGFDKANWQSEKLSDSNDQSLTLKYISRSGEEGYPGNLKVSVTYSLTEENELKIDYEAHTNQSTIVNLTHHSYFNLAGAGSSDILGHALRINADRITPVDNRLIPTGELRSVKGTPLDFTRPTEIGARITIRHHNASLYHRARYSILLGKLFRRWDYRQRRSNLWSPRRILFGNPALSGLSQPTGFSFNRA